MGRKIHTVGTVKEFLNNDIKVPTTNEKIFRYLEDNQTMFAALGFTALFVVGVPDIGLASTGLEGVDDFDKKGYAIYMDIMKIGKWIIIVKALIDIIKSVVQGDMDGGKRYFLQYLVVYLLMLALPWGYDRIEEIFGV